jgi:hypothetical protein
MRKVQGIVEFMSTSQYPCMDDSRGFLLKSDGQQSHASELGGGRLHYTDGAR